MAKFEAIFFDLDGTLVDTAPDLAYALNLLCEEQGEPTVDYDAVRAVASNGTAAILEVGFNILPDHAHYPVIQQRYLQLYLDNISKHSDLFEGMHSFLDTLEQHAIPWGVITNKPAFLTHVLMQGLGLDKRAVCMVSGDTTEHSKPHPAPMLHACKLAQVEPANCLYVGDAKRDIEAGHHVNMFTIAAAYGYIIAGDDPASWQADAVINHPSELNQWI